MEFLQKTRLEEILKSSAPITDHYLILPYLIPELRPCIGFEQHSKYHCHDVYDHILQAVKIYQDSHENKDWKCKLVLLLHDIGKPECFSYDSRGGHFYGHAQKGAEMSRIILLRLGYPEQLVSYVEFLVRIHDVSITENHIQKWINEMGKDMFECFLDIREADIKAHSDFNKQEKLILLDNIKKKYRDIIMVT